MTRIHHKIARLCLLLCAASAPMLASAQVPTVNLRFVSFPKAAGAGPVELVIGEGKTMEVELPTNSISKTYQVPALATWSLGKTTVNEEGKSTFLSYGNAPSIGAGEQLILVVRKGHNDAAGLQLIPMKNNDEGLGGGKYLLFNASQVDIAGAIGTGKFALEPGKHGFVAPKPTNSEGGRNYCFAKFYFRKAEGEAEDIHPFFSATWRFNQEARSVVFFYHDTQTRQLRVHTIRSFER